MSDPTNTPAGWYDDGSGRQRYWDGRQWTDQFAPAAPAADAAPEPVAPPPVEPFAPPVTEPHGSATGASAPTSPYGAPDPAPYGSAVQPGAPVGAASVAGAGAGAGYGTASSTPPPPGAKGKPHVLGIIALIVAAVGFVFACIPFAFVVGWVLLPIAFVLSIVALFMRGAKWAAITGLILSVLGTIAGFVVFWLVASVAVNQAIDELPSAIAEASEAAEDAADEPADDEAPPAAETLAFGDTMGWEDGLELTVAAPTPYTPTEFAAGADQAANLVFTLTITNNSTENFEPAVYSRLSSAGQESSQIFDVPADGSTIGIPPTTVVLPGESVTWQEAWSVTDANSLTMQISPNFDYEDAIYTNLQ
ncbi:DUF2510 domain-containing protein [Agromyces aureus]|uniref:DUF2510 domain-containing protein n=1 Tax=Agromyces aureus TaxID=453304 RepID=A0A191WIH4_9MICO|nr:DUF2510 domain-containing protein [Agromyces aureus]ANJ28115.1 hypothetical protein ATC03_16745 [Agromyces aureus]